MSDTAMNRTSIMERENISSIHRKRRLPADGWYFEVNICGQVFPGYGDTFEEALADAKARNAERLAA